MSLGDWLDRVGGNFAQNIEDAPPEAWFSLAQALTSAPRNQLGAGIAQGMAGFGAALQRDRKQKALADAFKGMAGNIPEAQRPIFDTIVKQAPELLTGPWLKQAMDPNAALNARKTAYWNNKLGMPSASPADTAAARANSGANTMAQAFNPDGGPNQATRGAEGPNAPALSALATSPVEAPAQFKTAIANASLKYGVPVGILTAMLSTESGFDPNAEGKDGEVGLGQLMPGTAYDMGVRDRYDPNQNIDGAARYLAENFKRAGNWTDALRGYNAGPTGSMRNPNAGREYANAILKGANFDPATSTTASPTKFGSQRDSAPQPVLPDGRTPSAVMAENSQRLSEGDAVRNMEEASFAGDDAGASYWRKYAEDMRAEQGAADDLNDPGTASYIDAIANYKMRPPSAGRNPQQRARIMKLVLARNPDFNEANFDVSQRARIAFGTGRQGDIVRSLNVGLDHLDTLSQLADALDTKNVQQYNKIMQWWAQQTGHPAPTNFIAAKTIVGNEVAKSIVGGQNAQADREEAQSAFAAAQSPAQLKGAIKTVQALMAGQVRGLKAQYERTTRAKDFEESFLDERARALVESAGTPPPRTTKTGGPQSGPVIPQGAIDDLKRNPLRRREFDLKYGAGASARYLGAR